MTTPPPKCKRCSTDKRHRLKIDDEWLCAECIESANAALREEIERLQEKGGTYFKSEIKTLNGLLSSAEEALRNVADQRNKLLAEREEREGEIERLREYESGFCEIDTLFENDYPELVDRVRLLFAHAESAEKERDEVVGVVRQFKSFYDNAENDPNGLVWAIGELLASIPDDERRKGG